MPRVMIGKGFQRTGGNIGVIKNEKGEENETGQPGHQNRAERILAEEQSQAGGNGVERQAGKDDPVQTFLLLFISSSKYLR